MTMYNPLVSIVVPVYNGSNYLAEAIDSALAQTYQNIEIIVVNDGSRDEGATAAVAAKYADKIRYFEKENGGSSSALNRGIREMRGEWFSWLSHDDLYFPDKVEKEVQYLRSLQIPEAELWEHVFFSGCELFTDTGAILMRNSAAEMQAMEAEIAATEDNAYFVAQPKKYTFHGCSCLIHKGMFERIGGFDESLRYLNDVELWFRMYAGGCKLHYVPQVLVRGRMHPKQVGRTVGYTECHPEGDRLWKKRIDWLDENRPGSFDLYVYLGKDAFRSGRYDDGNRTFARAEELKPEKKTYLRMIKMMRMANSKIRGFGKQIFVKLSKR